MPEELAGDLLSRVLGKLPTEKCLGCAGEAAGCCLLEKSCMLESRQWSSHRL